MASSQGWDRAENEGHTCGWYWAREQMSKMKHEASVHWDFVMYRAHGRLLRFLQCSFITRPILRNWPARIHSPVAQAQCLAVRLRTHASRLANWSVFSLSFDLKTLSAEVSRACDYILTSRNLRAIANATQQTCITQNRCKVGLERSQKRDTGCLANQLALLTKGCFLFPKKHLSFYSNWGKYTDVPKQKALLRR
jgi:hypothetical protein